ncbi:MAG: hypothetical protein NTZ56_17660 [Acidobacteria bacterium]|nr:hypothetical protein [Acidobacteriota bacterium]
MSVFRSVMTKLLPACLLAAAAPVWSGPITTFAWDDAFHVVATITGDHGSPETTDYAPTPGGYWDLHLTVRKLGLGEIINFKGTLQHNKHPEVGPNPGTLFTFDLNNDLRGPTHLELLGAPHDGHYDDFFIDVWADPAVYAVTIEGRHICPGGICETPEPATFSLTGSAFLLVALKLWRKIV